MKEGDVKLEARTATGFGHVLVSQLGTGIEFAGVLSV